LAAAVAGSGALRVEGDRIGVVRDRPVVIAFLPIGVAAVIIGLGVAWILLNEDGAPSKGPVPILVLFAVSRRIGSSGCHRTHHCE
jgi:hypothetical protein